MSRKDYQVIAEGLRYSLSSASPDDRKGVAYAARQVAEALKAANGRFRYDKFYEWVGLNEWGEVSA